MSRQVVITGAGLVSPLGDSPSLLHSALCEGRNGLAEIELFETDALSSSLGGEVPGFDPRTYLGKVNLRPLDRTSRLVVSAAHLALEDSGWTAAARAEQEIALVLGTMYCSVRTIAEFDRRATSAGPIYASPIDFANSVINAAAGQTAIWHGLRGVNSTIATGQASGLRAISYATALIESGRADVVLSGGAEELCLESALSFDRAGMIAADDGPDPIPFGASGRGLRLGEGAALVVLESAELAAARGVAALAEVRGSGVGFDPSRGKDERSAFDSTCRALRNALESAELGPEEIGAVSASANGGAQDELEARALADVFGACAERLGITAIKSALGESLGAAGGLQAVAALETIRTGELPGIRGLDDLPPGFPLPLAGSSTRTIEPRTVLLDSVGFDGHRCAVVLSASTT